MIQWPVVVKYHGVDELAYVSSESVWQNNVHTYAYSHHKHDYMVDTTGEIYQLEQDDKGDISTSDTGRTISIQEFIELVKRHAASSGECCSDKIQLRNFTDGFILVKGMRDD